MLRLIVVATAAVLLCGCSEDKPVQQEHAAAKALSGGQYEASWKVTALRSIDKSKPLTNLKMDAAGTTRACIAADGSVDPALFAEDGDRCTISNPYVRNGRMNLNLTCKRGSDAGELRQTVTGTFTADSLDAEVTTTTYLTGLGDYAMTRTVTAKRVGDCASGVESTGAAAGTKGNEGVGG